MKNKILIVDDEETLIWGMSKRLSKERGRRDIEVLSANSAEGALDILQQTEIDLIITDIRMPGMSGLELLSRVKSDYPGTDVIVMTAYGSPVAQQEAITGGSLYYVEKPFEMSEMEKLIEKTLQGRASGSTSSDGFTGNVSHLELADIIQVSCLGKLTCALKVTMGGEAGTIFFREGEIVHASCGDVKGKEALFQILLWRRGNFETLDDVLPPEETISEDWHHLLLEGAQKIDEATAPESPEETPAHVDGGEEMESQIVDYGVLAEGSTENDEAISPVDGDAALSLAEGIPLIEDVFSLGDDGLSSQEAAGKYQKLALTLRQVDKVGGVVVVANDGVVLGHSLEDHDFYGAAALYVGSAVSQIQELMGLSPFRSGLITGDGQRTLVMRKKCLYVGLLLEASADIDTVVVEAETKLSEL